MPASIVGGPPLLKIVSNHLLGDSSNAARMLPFDLIYWTMFGGALTVIIYVKRSL